MNGRLSAGVINLARCFAALAMASGLVLGAPSAEAADTIGLKLDQARVLQLPPHTSIVVIGNPIIADVTLLKKSNSMVLTGKSFGETNLIALDSRGQSLGESTVQVTAGSTTLIVQRGLDRQSYSCAPHCLPTFEVGGRFGLQQQAFVPDPIAQQSSPTPALEKKPSDLGPPHWPRIASRRASETCCSFVLLIGGS